MKIAKSVKYILSFILLFLAFFFYFVSDWVPANFGDISFSQIIFHLKAPMEGADTSFVDSFIIECIIPPLLLSSLLIILIKVFDLNKLNFLIHSKKTNRHIKFNSMSILSFMACIIAFNACANNLYLYDYINELLHPSSIFEDYYVDASTVDFTFPKEKQNLIYIYLESMETTYYAKDSGGAMDTNLIPELQQLANENVTFDQGVPENTGFYVPSGGTWTIGAMVAHSMGVPLKVPIEGNSYQAESGFLPGSYGIGDILEKGDYNQELLIGSDAQFGGRSYLYQQHGNYDIVDYYAAIKNGWIDKDYYQWWGYEDQKLYAFAKEELLRLATKEKPFNLTMLTTDTHHIGGYPCPKCPNIYADQYSNVIACASTQINEFVNWIKAQSFYENTTIVLCGDHKSMDPNYFQSLEEDYIRKGYYTIINSRIENENQNSRKITSFDLFPTTLASLGITYNSDRLGLGTNVFNDKKTLVEKLGWEQFQNQVQRVSNYYNKHILYGEEKNK